MTEMTKAELVERIETKRRQLERYIFHFEKTDQGAFVASDRPKFSEEGMIEPGVVDGWSLKDLLAQVTFWEEQFVRWYNAGLREERPGTPPPDVSWDDPDILEEAAPRQIQARPLESVLATFRISYQQVLATVMAIPDEELLQPGRFDWTWGAPLSDYVALCTYQRYDWAKELIRRWRKTHAGQYLNKEIILERIQTERRRLEQNLDNLSDKEMRESGVIDAWSVKDILAHLFDWEQRFLDWYRSGLEGEVPETPAPGLTWGQLDNLNERIYKKYRRWGLKRVLEASRRSYEEVLEVVASIPEEEMFEVGRYEWVGEENLVEFILANTANHYRWAKRQIRDWMKEEGKL